MQGGSVEPAYKKKKLAHLRVKVPGGVRTVHHNSLCVCVPVQAERDEQLQSM